MIKINRPGFKSFITYVFGFIFLTLFIYLAIPTFFNYKNNIPVIEKKISNNFGLKLKIVSKPKYNIFPSPRLNLTDVEILDFSDDLKYIGDIDKLVLKIPFKKLVSLSEMDFQSIILSNSVINIDTSQINNFKKFLNDISFKKPIFLKKTKINLLDNNNLLFSIDSRKLNILSRTLYKKVNLKGEIFNTKLKVNYQNKNNSTNIMIAFPAIGLNLKLNVNSDQEGSNNRYGRTSIFFPNNQFYLDYILNDNIISIASSRFINNYFKGKLFGDLILFPFFTFDLKLKINSLKFENILNNSLAIGNFLNKIIPINNKINGQFNIEIDEIASSSSLINSGYINLEFRNSIVLVKEINLNMDKMGNIKLNGRIFEQKKKKIFDYNMKINIDNPKNLYARFLIPKKNRKNLKPVSISGKVNLESYDIKIDQIYFDSELVKEELGKNEIIIFEDNINEILSENSIDNVLKYSNLRKIIQSFFILN